MEIVVPFIQEIITIASVGIIFAGVYKLFQAASDIREIKEAVLNAKRSDGHLRAPSSPSPKLRVDEDVSLESATSYAENLLRAVNAESANSPAASREPRP